MNASEAHALAASKLKGEIIKPLLDYVLKRIQAAAEAGRFELNHPYKGFKDWPSEDQKKALWQALRTLGYEVDHMPDPDPGYPGSSDYDRVSWK
jgi:hypothetical protein